jgi:iron(II)-dependent oxidoreductase
VELKGLVEHGLEEARRRSLALLDPQREEELIRQHSPLMSPLVWDLAHVANFEDIWLLRALGEPAVRPECDYLYDPARHPRSTRAGLRLLGPSDARSYASSVRSRALEVLQGVDLERAPAGREPGGRSLLGDAYVYGMVLQHEQQHDETMLATIQLSDGACDLAAAPLPAAATPPAADEVLVDAGTFLMGAPDDPWSYDNERPAHLARTGAFWIDSAPVTNGRYAEFVEDGGYQRPELWSSDGWAWRCAEGAGAPQFWRREASGSWSVRRFGRDLPLRGDEPVQHVSWYEADAFARWRGRRLPTEHEWEKAASWTRDGRKLRFPWGDQPPGEEQANLAQRHQGPSPVGSYPSGVSPWGCHQMIGDIWEWTSSDFLPYPGFAPYPYREYSQVFYGSSYKVLRGGSWATHPVVTRATFRNWDYPVRRQIFAGFRCARDAEAPSG